MVTSTLETLDGWLQHIAKMEHEVENCKSWLAKRRYGLYRRILRKNTL